MKSEEMRLAIADSRGFLRTEKPGFWYWPQDRTGLKIVSSRPYAELHELPNYPEDLNAILPLLPLDVRLVRKIDGWVVYDGSTDYAGNERLALAACEFYLRWKEKWKD